MEPRPLERGNLAAENRLLQAEKTLQWSHVLSNVETLSTLGPLKLLVMLQWSHVLSNVETFTVRRVPLEMWIQGGRLPQSFLAELTKAQRGEVEVDVTANLSADETIEIMLFLRDAVKYACVDPRLVIGATGDDELDPSELDPLDFEALTQWIMSGSPGLAVPTRKGAVSRESLSRFSQKTPGGRAAQPGADGGDVRAETQPDAWDPERDSGA